MQSLKKAVAILDSFSHAEPSLTLNDIAIRTGLPKGTAHRIVKALCHSNMLEQINPNGRYRLGIKLFEFGSLCLDRMELNRAAFLSIQKLRQVSGNDVHLCVFDGLRTVSICRKTMTSDPGNIKTNLEAAPAYCTGVGKAILAFQPDSVVDRIVNQGLCGFTPHTLSSPQRLRNDLVLIRERGYAIDDREHQPDIRCVAAPIRSLSGEVYAAISVSTTCDRMPDERFETIAEVVLEATRAIERRQEVIAKTTQISQCGIQRTMTN